MLRLRYYQDTVFFFLLILLLLKAGVFLFQFNPTHSYPLTVQRSQELR